MNDSGNRKPSRLWLMIFLMGIVVLAFALVFLPSKSPLQISVLILSMILFIISGLVGAARRPY